MPRILFFCLILCTLFTAVGVQAQTSQVAAIEDLEIQLWPDYDRRAVLVLLTGTLPAPGTLSLPLPADGEFLVLARIDSANTMIDDIGQPTLADGRATFTLPAPDTRFRLEYYLPYESEGNARRFSYTWLADIPANRVTVLVQRPAAATTMSVVPAAASEMQNLNDGLLYYELPAQTAVANQPITLQISYTMAADTLTASTITASPPLAPTGTPAAAANVNWGLVLGGLALVAATGFLVWQVALRQNGRNVRKPAPRRVPKTSRPAAPPRQEAAAAPPPKATVRFCHECGTAAQPEDRFCRSCGTALR